METIAVRLADNVLVGASKAEDCTKGSYAILENNEEVCIMQGYSPAGTFAAKSFTKVCIDKKHFPKLKTGLFSSTAKNVAGYFLYTGGVRLHFQGDVTTQKGKKASYNFYLTLQCTGFDTKKFAAMLKAIKYRPDADKIVISLETVSSILGDAIKDAMRTILDSDPRAYYVTGSGGRSLGAILDNMEAGLASKKAREKSEPILFAFLKERMLKIGLKCLMEI